MTNSSMKPLIIDTREPAEFAAGHVQGAIHISAMEFIGHGIPPALQGVAKEQPMILYCRSGQRSNTCIQVLRQHGFTHLTNGINQHHVEKMIAST